MKEFKDTWVVVEQYPLHNSSFFAVKQTMSKFAATKLANRMSNEWIEEIERKNKYRKNLVENARATLPNRFIPLPLDKALERFEDMIYEDSRVQSASD